MTLLLLQYNNYFDRTIKKFDTVAEYEAVAQYSYIQGVDFNPNEDVTTTQIINWNLEWTPDYLLVLSPDSTTIISRWFIIEAVRTRGKQYKLDLKRDVIAENYNAIIKAPCIVERGPIAATSPLIYNDEGMAFNEIKKSQTLLKDETGTPWIVGYISSDTDFEDNVVGKTESSLSYPELSTLGLVLNDNADPTAGATLEVLTESYVWVKNAGPAFTATSFGASIVSGSRPPESGWGPAWYNVEEQANTYSNTLNMNEVSDKFEDIIAANRATLMQYIRSTFNYQDSTVEQTVLALNNSVVYSINQNKYYQLHISSSTVKGTDVSDKVNLCKENQPQLYYALRSCMETLCNEVSGFGLYGDNRNIWSRSIRNFYTISLVEISVGGQIRTHIPNSRNHLVDAPYDMFAMPFNNDNLALARQLVIATPSGEGQKKLIYDVQILPFCPIREYVENGLTNMTNNIDYSKIQIYDDDLQDWKDWDYMFWGLKSSATFFINQFLTMAAPFALDREEIKIKVSNACEKWRLVSPNYNGAFEFNVAKNGGTVNSFRVDFTYRPQVPYIHVAPVFKGLYGNVNDDARGLICNGDFSIDLISDAWTQYQIQNKNYQNIFDTQIKTLDKVHGLEMGSAAIGSVVNAIGTGVGAGLMTGNVSVGTVAGAVSLGAGMADLGFQQAKFDAQRQASIDTFKYQLDNVKALPDTLTKISSYNVNNKYFPIIEYYSCTSEEVTAFTEFLKYRGFALNVFTTIDTVLKNRYNNIEYIKGKLVKFNEDTHVANDVSNAIYRELDQGVYL